MVEYSIEINNDCRLIGYIKDYLHFRNIDYTITLQGDTAIAELTAEDWEFKNFLAEIILNFYKFELLLNAIKFQREPTLSECAFLGSVMCLEKEIEIEKIIVIAEKTEVKNIEGFFNFCLCSMHENWQNLAILSNKLMSQCHCDKDLYSLTGFMLGIDDTVKSNIVVDYPHIFRGSDNDSIEIMQYFKDKEKNAILAILAQNPSDILVMDSQKVSKEFMQVIKALGE